MEYSISFHHPGRQFIDVRCKADGPFQSLEEFRLPQWRPGRYEMGLFAKNVKCLGFYNEKGEPLVFRKVAQSFWQVESNGAGSIEARYQYYAAELNAGSTWLDADQLYVNPVNCLMYRPGTLSKPCKLSVNVPSDYLYAGGLAPKSKLVQDNSCTYLLEAADFHLLVDSPFVASPSLQHNQFVLDGIEINIWVQGEVKPNWPNILCDFFIFINEAVQMFRGFPEPVYHFIIQVLPYRFYHGVEHGNSTVIALGPGIDFSKKELYRELLGVSCHELFHVWNVKHLRPADLLPYDYSRPNYSRLGYIYEGVTTYYGDFLLYRSGVFSDDDFFDVFGEQFQKHFDNPGRRNYSVADSSFDTWLDGYVPGVPGRKVSIYTEGCLIALMTDVEIRRITNNRHSLDDALRILWADFGIPGKGYTEADYISILERITATSWAPFFDRFVNGVSADEWPLQETLSYLGLELIMLSSPKPYEAFLGFKAGDQVQPLVTNIYPDSPADLAGLMLKDQIVSVNGMEVSGNLKDIFHYFYPKPLEFRVKRFGRITNLKMEVGKDLFYRNYSLRKKDHASDQQKQNFTAWTKRAF